MNLKTSLILGAALMACVAPAWADEYRTIRCSDLLDDANWAAHVVGWLDLQNRDGSTEQMDFVQAREDATRLRATCIKMPDLMLHEAVSASFPAIQYEGPLFDAAQQMAKTQPRVDTSVVSAIR